VFLSTFQPGPILLDLGFFQIRWYSIILILAITSGFLIFIKLYKNNLFRYNEQQPCHPEQQPCHPEQQPCHPEQQPCHPELVSGYSVKSRNKFGMTGKTGMVNSEIYNLFFYIIIFSIIGGRLVHILSFAKYYSQNLLEIFYIWNGGLSFYGAFIFGLLVLFYFSRGEKRKEKGEIKGYKKFKSLLSSFSFLNFFTFRIKNFLILTDIAVIGLSLSQSIGRWGNYFNQELFGKQCDYFFCIPIQNLNTHFHPVFLYESILMLLVFFGLFQVRRHAGGGEESREKQMKLTNIVGFITSIYLILHSIIRFSLEFLRLDIQPEFLNLRLFQYLAILEFILGIILLFFVKKWYNKSKLT